MYSISEVSNGVNESNSKDQCDEKWEKCGFFGTRDVSEITNSNGSTFTYVLRGVLIPSVGILGLIGNTLSIIIFNRPEMKIWNSNGSYEMTKTSFIIKGKKYFIKDRRKSTYVFNIYTTVWTVKVHVFWEGHKNWSNLQCHFDVY